MNKSFLIGFKVINHNDDEPEFDFRSQSGILTLGWKSI